MDQSHDDIAVGGLDTPVGRISVALTQVGLVDVGWAEPDELAERAALPVVADTGRVAPALHQLAEYFLGTRRSFDLPLDWRHTRRSQRTVLQTLYAAVGYGSSITYGELALRSNAEVPARGIGAIMGSNPIPIVVPCHRVVAHDGLGGYSGGSGRDGLEVKRWLLTLEGVLPPTLDWSPGRVAPVAPPRSGRVGAPGRR
ncbi:MAG: methylated-DNA--[protein]-cysteine S-methyltransferase [Jiangellaceae bacterium]